MQFRLATWVGLVALAGGCAANAKAERPDQALDATSAYVYGRFVIKAAPSQFGEKGRGDIQTVGVVLTCNDGARYPLLFSTKNEVRVVKLRPASCGMEELEYVDDIGTVEHREPPANWVHLDYFAPGSGSRR